MNESNEEPSAPVAETPAVNEAPSFQRDLPRPSNRRWLIAAAALTVASSIGLGSFAARWWSDWNYLGKIEPSGGRYFFKRVEIPVPAFRQNDPVWGDDQLAATPDDTLGSAGCAVASAAMVLKSYGVDVDPQRLNWYLQAVDGFTPQGWMFWEKASDLAPDRVRHIYEDLPSHRLIDTNLANGNPVIIRIRRAGGSTHFVVIAGKDGFDYLIQDPATGASRQYRPLRELGSQIEALRFYEKLVDGSVAEVR